MILTLNQMVEKVLSVKRKYRVAVAWAQDPYTIGAIHRTVSEGFTDATLIGRSSEIINTCRSEEIDENLFQIVEADDDSIASSMAVGMVKNGQADIVMKGLVGTDIFLKSVMDRENGLMLPGAVLSYVGAIQIPAYHKLLFITDPAVIPYPNLDQKVSMVSYAVDMAHRFGIPKPKVALIAASEKRGKHFSSSADYSTLVEKAEKGEIKDCIIDGPLDLFLACDKSSVEIKGIKTPVNGEADILMFPSLESCNPFYKALMLFARGELAGIIRGTEKPVVVMSRSESSVSKYYCIGLACLMV
ncbi:MAG: phosphate acetyltransferase [Bacteroidetes bacterium GWE2_41_25]|nr:MAG: phosphate acetyltransferase [Bacteroidetes bacterium GWA2_40_15]OFX92248.1 MAG: phosphate acetyltransferase [Bacteroidetes bacterium GWC2_40_22]OFY02057.1 MAG: phosphate acetyltransferase [Bacteroidetes bacterium GWE2_41_25]OFY61926.1 MAG: phosphate acetyltransferase [Bacteroidetes bacterium GWF2_41_9]HAM09069.1 phosphate acetyltransferase [Bacteroidales bacterium]